MTPLKAFDSSGAEIFVPPNYHIYTSEFSNKVAPSTDNTPINEIYDISLNEEMEKVFYDVFFYSKTTLDVMEEGLDIQNARFYFYKHEKINATAYQYKNFNFVAISVGLVNFFHSYTKNLISVFTSTKELNHILSDKPYESGLETYMFKCIMRFIVKHEQAHLIQNKKRNQKQNEFYFADHTNSKNQDFILEKHLCEIDADHYAATTSYMYMKEYQFNNFKNTDREDTLNKIAVTLATILLYFFRTHDTFENFYTFKKDHPHHLMRISYITAHFVRMIKEDLKLGYDFSREEVLLGVRNICKHISGFDQYKMNKHNIAFNQEMHQYIEWMDEASKLFPFLVSRSLNYSHPPHGSATSR